MSVNNSVTGEKIMIKTTLLEKLEALPESLQTEVIHYIEFLLEKYAKTQPPSKLETVEEQNEKRYGYGSLAGKIIMSDDFDEPLEELEKYM
ncbi:DUF2281 domain-containing protein [Pannus brasiliensis CCIBt3594]|uniref:DUF2281 domain-containing protein n=1 Tax=Pannus brasiliensis CCIBt3594 TaxID=1427578 RepID=A0AAW9QWR3_9CHRO